MNQVFLDSLVLLLELEIEGGLAGANPVRRESTRDFEGASWSSRKLKHLSQCTQNPGRIQK